MEMAAQVRVFKRQGAKEMIAQLGAYQADIVSMTIVGGGGDHHGAGSTPAEALMQAALHWYRHEARVEARKEGFKSGFDDADSRHRYPDLSGS